MDLRECTGRSLVLLRVTPGFTHPVSSKSICFIVGWALPLEGGRERDVQMYEQAFDETITESMIREFVARFEVAGCHVDRNWLDAHMQVRKWPARYSLKPGGEIVMKEAA